MFQQIMVWEPLFYQLTGNLYRPLHVINDMKFQISVEFRNVTAKFPWTIVSWKLFNNILEV